MKHIKVSAVVLTQAFIEASWCREEAVVPRAQICETKNECENICDIYLCTN